MTREIIIEVEGRHIGLHRRGSAGFQMPTHPLEALQGLFSDISDLYFDSDGEKTTDWAFATLENWTAPK